MSRIIKSFLFIFNILLASCSHQKSTFPTRIPAQTSCSADLDSILTPARKTNFVFIETSVAEDQLALIAQFDQYLTSNGLSTTDDLKVTFSSQWNYPTYFYYLKDVVIPHQSGEELDLAAIFHEMSHNSFKNNINLRHKGEWRNFQSLFDRHVEEVGIDGNLSFLDSEHALLSELSIPFDELFADLVASLYLKDPDATTKSLAIQKMEGGDRNFSYSTNGHTYNYWRYPNHSYPRSFSNPISFNYKGNGINAVERSDFYSSLDATRKAIWAFIHKPLNIGKFSDKDILASYLEATAKTMTYLMNENQKIDTRNARRINQLLFKNFVDILRNKTSI